MRVPNIHVVFITLVLFKYNFQVGEGRASFLLFHQSNMFFSLIKSSVLLLIFNSGVVYNQLTKGPDKLEAKEILETCNTSWINFSPAAFKQAVAKNVYGQPIDESGLSEAIQYHWNNTQTAKALVLSMHGPTGTGKNYVTKILANHLFKKGVDSRFYHFSSAILHFNLDSQLKNYAEKIKAWIRECPKSVFVLDEVDKIPQLHRLFDALRPFLDYHESIDGSDFRSAIFIFLFNEGSGLIQKHMAEQKRMFSSKPQEKLRREVYYSFDLNNQLQKYLYTESLLSSSALLRHRLVSHFITFLPLERDHVISCIEDYLNDEIPNYFTPLRHRLFIDRVLKDLTFIPEAEKFFAEVGCKKVYEKAQTVQEEMQIEKEKENYQEDKFRVKAKKNKEDAATDENLYELYNAL